MSDHARLGATVLGDGRCRFLVWAPQATTVDVHLLTPTDCYLPLTREPHGYFGGLVDDLPPGARYRYRLDGAKERPDPASRWQPAGVHGPSAVVDPATFTWHDQAWRGRLLTDLILYELHVGAYTPEGAFDAVIPQLASLIDLGVTAVELMPVAQFPGERNWGYDGVQPFAVQHSYGGPDGLRRLVDACHQRGLAVVLDVVYNHLGPEGNYLGDYGPYFTSTRHTPWGDALNLDGPDSDEVRRFFIENALMWLTEYHIDGFRLDAIDAIVDASARPFLAELTSTVHRQAERLGRRCLVIAESDLNDARVIQPPSIGGYGLDAQWSDDLHHALHGTLTGERTGYYADFTGLADLATAFRTGFVYRGQYSAYRRRRHGNAPHGCRANQFVVCSQNHDQVGNRARGDRLSTLVDFERLKLAAAAVILSPFLPLLFMGEEYGELAPFQYFTSHGDPALIAAVRAGRRDEFAAFVWQGEVPDPQDEATFQRSKLNHALRHQGRHHALWHFYRTLIDLRRTRPALSELSLERLTAQTLDSGAVLVVRRWTERERALLLLNAGDAVAPVALPLGAWHKRLDSAEPRWLGPGSPLPDQVDGLTPARLALPPVSAVLYTQASEAAP